MSFSGKTARGTEFSIEVEDKTAFLIIPSKKLRARFVTKTEQGIKVLWTQGLAIPLTPELESFLAESGAQIEDRDDFKGNNFPASRKTQESPYVVTNHDAEWNDDQNFHSLQNPFYQKKPVSPQLDENDRELLSN
jgi:hypothetical protein